MNNKALIVVDVTNAFTKIGPLSGEYGKKIIPNVVQAVQDAIDEGRDIIFTTDWHDEDDLEFKRFPNIL